MGRRNIIINPQVSVIIPTCRRYEVVLANVLNIQQQNYPKIEILVCDDSNKEYLIENMEAKNKLLPHCRYFYCSQYDHEGKKDYGLARARNTGIIHANGQVLVFLDDRITPANPDMIRTFVDKILEKQKQKVWFFGEKGGNKSSFVENCSAILRKRIIEAGMFNERLQKYGAMTRELIGRFSAQGFSFEYVPEALAMPLDKSRDRDRKEAEILESREILRKLGW